MRIVVVGDVVVDHHIYEGERPNPSAMESRGVRVVREMGGASALARLIEQMCKTTGIVLKNRRKEAEIEFAEKMKEFLEAGEDERSGGKPKKEGIEFDPLEEGEVQFGLNQPDVDSQPCGHHGFAVFKPYPVSPDQKDSYVWRANALLGFGHDNPHPAETDTPHSLAHCDVFHPGPIQTLPADILILDDAAYMFRENRKCWLLDEAEKAKWIVMKVAAPVCKGELWQEVLKHAKKLIVVVSASELRKEKRLGVSQGLSWERTIEDLSKVIEKDPLLKPLRQCRHLLVTFSADGALWLQNPVSADDQPKDVSRKACLVYDPSSIEGQWAEQTKGEVFGYLSCLVAAVTRSVARSIHESSPDSDEEAVPELGEALSAGLAAMRNLRMLGHGRVSEGTPNGYPVERLSSVLCEPGERFAQCAIPWQDLCEGQFDSRHAWSIAVRSQVSQEDSTVCPIPLNGLARQVVFRGNRVLTHLPHATFGKLFTVDRNEIETLRTLRQLMKDYREQDGNSHPLSIGVFGPPGAGKSFGVKQIAEELFGEKAWLEFNLSQFSKDDFVGALHQVRDKGLQVRIPVVFWDEFDSRNYFWFQYLLAPMQDGRFQEGQLNHPIGKCIFIFAGATGHTFQQFGPPRVTADDSQVAEKQTNNTAHSDAKKKWEDYVLAKGPDFVSRLDGYYNVLGPNHRIRDGEKDESDVFAPLRRAILLRSFLCGNAKDRLRIDLGLLRALLEVPFYRNGARSLKKLARELKPAKPGGPVCRSDLCSPTQLAMLVEFAKHAASSDGSQERADLPEDVLRKFTKFFERDEEYLATDVIQELAVMIHASFVKLARNPDITIQEQYRRTFDKLKPGAKEANLAAARRIPEVLAVAGLKLVPVSSSDPGQSDVHREIIRAHIEQHLEIMAELEHDLWCDERREAGWRYGKPRCDERRVHNWLIPYEDLPEAEKAKDRDSVRNFPDHARSVGYSIVFG